MKLCVTLLPLLATALMSAGEPLYDVLRLRTIEVRRFEAVTENNVAEVSGFVRAPSPASGIRPDPSEVAGSVPGFLVEGIVKRQRDVAFPFMGGEEPVEDTAWADGDESTPVQFFVPRTHPDACEMFVPGRSVNVVLSQKVECDTYPPTGVCAFDYPIHVVDRETWTKFGE